MFDKLVTKYYYYQKIGFLLHLSYIGTITNILSPKLKILWRVFNYVFFKQSINKKKTP